MKHFTFSAAQVSFLPDKVEILMTGGPDGIEAGYSISKPKD
jgi:hypothetical protein